MVERPLDVGQWQDRECSEPVRAVVLDAREVFIDMAREVACRRLVAEVSPREC